MSTSRLSFSGLTAVVDMRGVITKPVSRVYSVTIATKQNLFNSRVFNISGKAALFPFIPHW